MSAEAIVALVSGLIAVVPAIFKKKAFVLWYRNDAGKWEAKAGPFSARQSRAALDGLVKTGEYEFKRFAIFRKGVDPNPGK